MVLPANQIYIPSGAAEIRSDFLTDIRLEAINQGLDPDDVPTQPETDWYILGTAHGNISLIQYANIRISDDNSHLNRATGVALDEIREDLGLPEVPASPSSGSVFIVVQGGGLVTIPADEPMLLPNGLRAKALGSVGVGDGDPIPIVAVDTGTDTNLGAGEVVRFIAPPVNVGSNTTVDPNDPLAGGLDAETDERKRDRIFNRLQNVPAGGNFGHMIEVALNSLASLQQVFVYPAIGGPASSKIVLLRAFDADANDYSRVPSLGAVEIVKAALQAEFPSPMEIVVQSILQEPTDVAIELTIPDSALSGGAGTGWLDSAVWPPLEGGDGGRIRITGVFNNSQIEISAVTVTPPVAGQTHVMWWSKVDQRFYTRLVTVVAGGSGAWVLTLDTPFADSDGGPPLITEFISPGAVNADGYGATWLTSIGAIGAGENSANVNFIPRALRHPFVADGQPSDLTIAQLLALDAAHAEISDLDYTHRSLPVPTVPASIDDAPNVLGPGDFALYKK